MFRLIFAATCAFALATSAFADITHWVSEPYQPAVTPGSDLLHPDFNDGSYWTVDLMVTISDDDDWSSTGVDATIDSGMFFQHGVGGDCPPLAALVGIYPALEYDCFYLSTEPDPANQPPFKDPHFADEGAQDQHVWATWWDMPPNGGDGHFVIARFTVKLTGEQALLTLEGASTTFDYGGELFHFSFEVPIPGSPPEDCNNNGIPDYLDMANCDGSPWCSDCNNNGIIDECDILDGTSRDCQPNGVPDECELEAARLLVCSKDTDSVLLYDGHTGEFRGEFVQPGEYGLDFPNGITVDDSGYVYVASVYTNSVLQLSSVTGELLHEFAGCGLEMPVGLLVREPDTLFVSGWASDSVVAFDLVTLECALFVEPGSGGLDGPNGLAFAPNGNLLVASQHTHQVLEYDGQTGAYVGVAAEGCGLDIPAGLAVDAEGNLLVSSFGTDSVLRFELGAGCEVCVPSGSGGLVGPEGLAWGPNGNLFVSSLGTDQVLEYAAADECPFEFVRVFAEGGGLQGPEYLAFATFTNDYDQDGVPDECATVPILTDYWAVAWTERGDEEVVHNGPAHAFASCSGGGFAYSSVALEAVFGDDLRGTILVEGEASYTPDDFESCGGAGGSIDGTLEIGTSDAFPPGRLLVLTLQVRVIGHQPAWEEDYLLQLWQDNELIAHIDPSHPDDVVLRVRAGETLTAELSASVFPRDYGWYYYGRCFEYWFIIAPWPCPGDVTGDGDTDQVDLGILLALWGECEDDPNYDPAADLDNDGCIGHGDLGILLADWGCEA